MSILDYFIRRKVREIAPQVIRENLPAIAERIAADMVKDLWSTEPRFRFLKWMQWEMQRVDPSLSAERSFAIAKETLRTNLADDKCEFGDPRFAWDEGGAIDLIHAYEIDHWERAA